MRFTLLLLCVASLIGCGGNDRSDLPGLIGESCTVFFRRDALGMSADLPAPPLSSTLNGAEMSISGELLETSESWIRVGRNSQEITIPRSVILMIRQQPQTAS